VKADSSASLPAALYAALVPLVGEQVRATVLDARGRPLVTLFGAFGGSCDVGFEDRRLALIVECHLIELELSELREVRRLNLGVIGGRRRGAVVVRLDSGTSIEVEPDVVALAFGH
jgi:hypothetical protein